MFPEDRSDNNKEAITLNVFHTLSVVKPPARAWGLFIFAIANQPILFVWRFRRPLGNLPLPGGSFEF
ncbi:MAG: hypothetical protein F6J93_19175 [Oscillatoria sp. SIO1A7]|nr:hypothetical protein [Oscillatoria sp. SIO1A7]